jgi:hypothetical protein
VGLKVEDCEVLLEHRALRVLGPPPDFIFLMKLYAARAPDYDDLVALWPYCSFGTADEAGTARPTHTRPMRTRISWNMCSESQTHLGVSQRRSADGVSLQAPL